MKKDDPLALLGLGDSLFALAQYEEAEAVYKKILEVSPGVPEALKNLEIITQKKAATTVSLDTRPHPRSSTKSLRRKR
jgi:tetratricopeptide (TPR) repeat protein